MFRGRFDHSIDGKGRMSIPSKIRDVLNDKYDSRLVVTTYDGCLIVYPNAEWKVLEDRIAQLPEFNKDTRAFLRFFYSSASDCPIDKLGRILVPQSLRDYAGLEKDVVIVGAFKHIEIWNKSAWDAAEQSTSVDAISSVLERLGL